MVLSAQSGTHGFPNGFPTFLHGVSGSICTALTDFGSGPDFLCSRFFCFSFLFVFVFCGYVARLTTLSVFQSALNFLHHIISYHIIHIVPLPVLISSHQGCVYSSLSCVYSKCCICVCAAVSLPLTKALESTSKTFEDIGKLYTEEVA